MLIQFGHSKDYDYEKELYEPIKKSHILKENKIILPHDNNNSSWVDSKETLKKADIFFAEVSYPATGLGIELWFANIYWIKIVCFSKNWTKISWSLKYVCEDFFEYENSEDMIKQIEEKIETHQKQFIF